MKAERFFELLEEIGRRTRTDVGAEPAPAQLAGRCSHDPMTMLGKPVGMYHCPECMEMVIAGLPHPEPDEDVA